jgi:hypothetical protein
MRAGRWCTAALLAAVAALDGTGATYQELGSSAGHVQANDGSSAVKPGSNGFGTVTYGSASSDSGDSSDDAAARLKLEQAEALQPNLRLRLGIGI